MCLLYTNRSLIQNVNKYDKRDATCVKNYDSKYAINSFLLVLFCFISSDLMKFSISISSVIIAIK